MSHDEDLRAHLEHLGARAAEARFDLFRAMSGPLGQPLVFSAMIASRIDTLLNQVDPSEYVEQSRGATSALTDMVCSALAEGEIYAADASVCDYLTSPRAYTRTTRLSLADLPAPLGMALFDHPISIPTVSINTAGSADEADEATDQAETDDDGGLPVAGLVWASLDGLVETLGEGLLVIPLVSQSAGGDTGWLESLLRAAGSSNTKWASAITDVPDLIPIDTLPVALTQNAGQPLDDLDDLGYARLTRAFFTLLGDHLASVTDVPAGNRDLRRRAQHYGLSKERTSAPVHALTLDPDAVAAYQPAAPTPVTGPPADARQALAYMQARSGEATDLDTDDDLDTADPDSAETGPGSDREPATGSLPGFGDSRQVTTRILRDLGDGDPHYRLYLPVATSPDLLDRACATVSAWLIHQGYRDHPSLREPGHHRLADHFDLAVARYDTKRAATLLVQLTDTTRPTDPDITRVVVHHPSTGEGWLLVTRTQGETRIEATPSIARVLMDMLPVHDGAHEPLTGTATRITGSNRAPLARAVADIPNRRLPVLLTGSSDLVHDADAWAKVVDVWADQFTGLATVIFADPEATQKTNTPYRRRNPDSPFTPAPVGGLTIIMPSQGRADTQVHWMPGATVREEGTFGLGEAVFHLLRTYAATAPLPPAVQQRLNALDRAYAKLPPPTTPATEETEDRAVAASGPAPTDGSASTESGAPEAPGHPVDPDWLHDPALHQIYTDLDLPCTLDATPTALTTLAAAKATAEQAATAAETQIGSLEEQLARAHDLAEDTALALRQAEEDRVRTEDEARWLRARLAELTDADTAWQAPPAEATTTLVTDLTDLLTRLPDLAETGVVFTGDPDPITDLATQDTLGNIALVAWESLLVLGDYAAAKRNGDHTGNFRQYLLHTPSGYRTMSVHRLAVKESEQTMAMYGEERIFPVPTTVDPSGTIAMEAHLKLPKLGILTPRIHFHDDTHASGNVYVGYLGRHLRTPATN